jgi:hypothetical protein
MDSSSECGTKLDFSNESNPPPLVKTVSDPVIGIKKKAKCFDNKWPFEDYRSRLSEAEILIFENKKNSQRVKSWVIFRRYGLLDPINFALIIYVCLCTCTLTLPQLISLIYRSGAKCRYPDSPHYTHIWDMMLLLMEEIVLHGSRIVSKWFASRQFLHASE